MRTEALPKRFRSPGKVVSHMTHLNDDSPVKVRGVGAVRAASCEQRTAYALLAMRPLVAAVSCDAALSHLIRAAPFPYGTYNRQWFEGHAPTNDGFFNARSHQEEATCHNCT